MIVRNVKGKGVIVPRHNQRFTFGDDPDVYVSVYISDCTKCALGSQAEKCLLVDCAINNIHFIKQTLKL